MDDQERRRACWTHCWPFPSDDPDAWGVGDGWPPDQCFAWSYADMVEPCETAWLVRGSDDDAQVLVE